MPAINNISVGFNHLPAYHNNISGEVVATVTSANRMGDLVGKAGPSEIISAHYCAVHWGANVVKNHFDALGITPLKIFSGSQLIHAAEINSLKSVVNILIYGWKQTNGTRTYAGRTVTNTSVNMTDITTNAAVSNLVFANIWKDVTTKLNNFSNSGISGSLSGLVLNEPNTTAKLSRDSYNNLVQAIIYIAQACKCNSDCACNSVCNCNANCGCNY